MIVFFLVSALAVEPSWDTLPPPCGEADWLDVAGTPTLRALCHSESAIEVVEYEDGRWTLVARKAGSWLPLSSSLWADTTDSNWSFTQAETLTVWTGERWEDRPKPDLPRAEHEFDQTSIRFATDQWIVWENFESAGVMRWTDRWNDVAPLTTRRWHPLELVESGECQGRCRLS